MKKKLVSTIVLILVFSLIMQVPALAASTSSPAGLSTNHYTEIHSQLDMIMEAGTSYPLSYNSLSSLRIGAPITTYEFTNTGLRQLDLTLYPIFSAQSIPYIAMQVKLSDGRTVMQVSENDIPELASFNNKEIAIIYDATKYHIVSNDKICVSTAFPLGSPSGTTYRAHLNTANLASSLLATPITYTTINASYPLNYTPSQVASRSSLVSLNVDLIYQTEDKICWAACVASISNKLASTSYSAADIAIAVAGSSNPNTYNVSKTMTQITSILRTYSGASYYNSSIAPTQQCISNNLTSGYPLVGGFHYTGGKHAVVIRGLYMNSYIQLMDPYNGFHLAYLSNGVFSYTYSSSGYTYTLSTFAAKSF